jgi:hypothetical protein
MNALPPGMGSAAPHPLRKCAPAHIAPEGGVASVFKNLFSTIIPMGTRKAFVFSLDSFVAFILTVAALYSLLFFATVPSAYYSSLMQANYLAKDTILALSTSQISEGTASLYNCNPGTTALACVLSDLEADADTEDGDKDEPAARDLIGVAEGSPPRSALIPPQFGYKIEIMQYEGEIGEGLDLEGADWVEMYDTANDPNSANKKEYNKLKAASHSLFFGYEKMPFEDGETTLRYVSCGGKNNICEWPGAFAYDADDYNSNLQGDMRGDAFTYVVRFTVYT